MMVVHSDPASCANFRDVTVKHLHVEWTVDFTAEILLGNAVLDCEVLRATDHVNLDVRGLHIRELTVNGKQGTYQLTHQKLEAFGQCMRIDLQIEAKPGDKLRIGSKFETVAGDKLSGLQWLPKEQTADKLEPMVFSYCQEINARSIVPCMDTPSVKQTYTAKLSVPSRLTALCSAVSSNEPVDDQKFPGHKICSFDQKVPVPSYLFAFVVAKLQKRDLSNRCAVWAEGSVVDKAAYEFGETEQMLQTAEQLLGPYVWGRYDILVLPPSFPFGGMENPCLTFVTPTLLAGDRSLAAIIAHEISHSWTGNLVTNSTWEHMWINEGFTMFVERKILGRLFGEPYRHFMALNGWSSQLEPAVYEQHSPDSPFTKLVQCHKDIDPKDAFSFVPYEKGHSFLFYLEEQLGGGSAMDDFLRAYINNFAHQSIDTDTWKEFFLDYLIRYHQAKAIQAVDFDNWLHSPGMPPVKPNFDRTLEQDCSDLRDVWSNASDIDALKLDGHVYSAFSPMQKVQFVSLLCDLPQPLSHTKLAHIEKVLHLAETENCEIITPWIIACLRAHWQSIIPRALAFLTVVGRLKLVRPIYRELARWDATQAMAIKLFKENRQFMHPITVAMVEKELGLRE